MLITYNWKLKQLARWALSQRWITRNKLYLNKYQQVMEKKIREKYTRPDRVRLENTNICHSYCDFCPHVHMKRKKGYMSMKMFKNLAGQIKEWGVPEIVIQGFGEPLEDPNFFERIHYAKKIGIPKRQTNINGAFINGRNTEALLNCGLTELFISCNPHAEFNVKYLLKHRKKKLPKIYLSFIKGETKPFKTNADGVSISYPHNWGGAIRSISNSPRDPCRLCFVTMYITWDGFAHICCMDYEAEYKYGHVESHKLKDLWKQNVFQKIHENREWEKIEICRNCSYNAHNKSPWWIK